MARLSGAPSVGALLTNGCMRKLIALCLVLLVGVACRRVLPAPVRLPTLTPSSVLVTPSPAVPLPTITPAATPTLVPTATPTTPPSPTPAPDLSLTAADVVLYPTPRLYVGDQVTFQISPHIPPGVAPGDVAVRISLDGEVLVDNRLNRPNLGGAVTGLYEWVWYIDQPGDYHVTVELDPRDEIKAGDANPANNIVQLTVSAAPVSTSVDAPPPHIWRTLTAANANIHVVTGTAADRDAEQLTALVEQAVARAAAILGVTPAQPVEIFFIERILGQGGYAGSAMVITYADRNYAGGGLYEVLVHESIHVLDNRFEPPDAFRFITEGLAVWGAGGHYKPESLDQRAAALLMETDHYIPLATLIDDFYPAQHEVGYLEAGALVAYLVPRYGWERVRDLYSSLRQPPGVPESLVMDTAFQAQLGKTLAQIETDWHTYLRQQPRDPNAAADLLTTIRYYDVMRQYQQQYDPTAYFLDAWLPTPGVLLERELTAEVTRRPTAEVNVALETMLEAADMALRQAQIARANALLDSVERVLKNNGAFVDPLAVSYLELVRLTANLGYEAQTIDIADTMAIVMARSPNNPILRRFNLSLSGQTWEFSN